MVEFVNKYYNICVLWRSIFGPLLVFLFGIVNQLPRFFPKESNENGSHQWSGRFLGIIGGDPSICKSNRLHVGILRFCLYKLGYILWIPLKWSVLFLQFWTSTGYFSNSTGSFVTNCRFSPIIGSHSNLWSVLQIWIFPRDLFTLPKVTPMPLHEFSPGNGNFWQS